MHSSVNVIYASELCALKVDKMVSFILYMLSYTHAHTHTHTHTQSKPGEVCRQRQTLVNP